jgi:hypothetical protein
LDGSLTGLKRQRSAEFGAGVTIGAAQVASMVDHEGQCEMPVRSAHTFTVSEYPFWFISFAVPACWENKSRKRSRLKIGRKTMKMG